MNFFKLIVTLFFFSFTSLLKSQYTTHSMISAGYVYQNQSFGEVGGKLLFIKKDEIAYRIGASALLGASNGKFAILPKVQGDIMFNFRKNVDIYHGFYYLAGVESTSKYVSPYIGINVLGILDFKSGYAFSYRNKPLNDKELKGINFGIVLNIPLSVFK